MIELLGTFLIECGQQFLPTINALLYMLAGALLFAAGIWFKGWVK